MNFECPYCKETTISLQLKCMARTYNPATCPSCKKLSYKFQLVQLAFAKIVYLFLISVLLISLYLERYFVLYLDVIVLSLYYLIIYFYALFFKDLTPTNTLEISQAVKRQKIYLLLLVPILLLFCILHFLK